MSTYHTNPLKHVRKREIGNMNIVRSGLEHLLLKTKMGEHNAVKVKRGVSK